MRAGGGETVVVQGETMRGIGRETVVMGLLALFLLLLETGLQRDEKSWGNGLIMLLCPAPSPTQARSSDGGIGTAL